jgi:hypothetical protein
VGISKSHLFDVFDLHAKKNMPQVMCNLEAVSKMKVYDPERGVLSEGPSLPPPIVSRPSKKWEVEIRESVHVGQLTDDQLFEELVATRRQLNDANRQIEQLRSEVLFLREKLRIATNSSDTSNSMLMESPSKRSWNVPIVGEIVKMLSPRRQPTETPEKTFSLKDATEGQNTKSTATTPIQSPQKSKVPPIKITRDKNERPKKQTPKSTRKTPTSKSPRKTPRSQQQQQQQQQQQNKRCWNVCVIC